MIKQSMREALKSSLMGMKSKLRNARGKKAAGDDDDEEEEEDIEGTPEHEASESKAERVAEKEGSDEDYENDKKSFMKNKRKPSGKKTAFAIAVLAPMKKMERGSGGKFMKKG